MVPGFTEATTDGTCRTPIHGNNNNNNNHNNNHINGFSSMSRSSSGHGDLNNNNSMHNNNNNNINNSNNTNSNNNVVNASSNVSTLDALSMIVESINPQTAALLSAVGGDDTAAAAAASAAAGVHPFVGSPGAVSYAVGAAMGVVGECGTGVPSAGSYGDGSGVINPGIVCGVGGGVGGGAVGGGSLEAAMGCVAERMSLGSESKPIVVMTS